MMMGVRANTRWCVTKYNNDSKIIKKMDDCHIIYVDNDYDEHDDDDRARIRTFSSVIFFNQLFH